MKDKKVLLMGNAAIAMGALRAGVSVVTGYPGTPSTEILETVAKHNDGSVHVEWSVNEKAALEVAAGAAYSGARVLVTMKQVGLNVASDPLMSLVYIGVKGGLVIAVADDPGPISSQTEQDTRTFAQFAKLPVFDPSSPEEAYEMIADAFDYSEKYSTPVLFRPTTRIDHASAGITLLPKKEVSPASGFEKDPSRWVIFPRLSYANHIKLENREPVMGEDFSSYRFNKLSKPSGCRKGIACGGISYAYVQEAIKSSGLENKLACLKVATPFPFPTPLAEEFLSGLDEVLVIEELDPVIERALLTLCGEKKLSVKIRGKKSGDAKVGGENSTESVSDDISAFLGIKCQAKDKPAAPALPVRPPVLCAGCPHRASFFAVKEACKGKKAVFCGDIGCYTLGNAAPLGMVDTCLCMGADVTIAQGIGTVTKDTLCFSFIGDSTFFASGMTGVANAVYNKHDIILIVLDNSTTAMTGHQPHPGTGKTMMNTVSEKIDIAAVLRALGVSSVEEADPLNLSQAIAAVKKAQELPGVKAIIFRSPCISVTKKTCSYAINTDKCIGCKACVTKLGCPALILNGKKPEIDTELCFGCSLCAQVCPVSAIERKANI